MYFTHADQINHNSEPIQRAENTSQETMGHALSVRIDVDYNHIILDGDGSWDPFVFVIVWRMGELSQEREWCWLWDTFRAQSLLDLRRVHFRVWVYDSAPTTGIPDIFNPDGYFFPDGLFHGKRMYHFAAIIR